MNQIMKTAEFDIKDLADPGSSKVWEMTGLHLENAGEALGKPTGFGRRDVGARWPQIELRWFSWIVIIVCHMNIVNKLYVLWIVRE